MDRTRSSTDHSATASALLRAMTMTYSPDPHNESGRRCDQQRSSDENEEERSRWPNAEARTSPRRGRKSTTHTKYDIRPTDSLAYIFHALDGSDASRSTSDHQRRATIADSYRSLEPLHANMTTAYRSTPRMGVRNLSYAAPFVSPTTPEDISLTIQPNVDSPSGISVQHHVDSDISILSNITDEERLMTMANRPGFPKRKARVSSVRWSDTPSADDRSKEVQLYSHTPAADMSVKFPSEMLSVKANIWRRFPQLERSHLGKGDEQFDASSLPLAETWSREDSYVPVTSPLCTGISDTALWEDNVSAIQKQFAVPLQTPLSHGKKFERSSNDVDDWKQRDSILETTPMFRPLIVRTVTGQSPSIAKILTLHYNKEGKCSEKVRLKLALSEGAVVPSRSNFNKYTHDEAMLRRRSLDEKIASVRMDLHNRRRQMGGCHLFFYNLMMWFKRRQYQPDSNPLFAGHISRIEGKFGSGVTSLFIFTRWLLLLNLFLSILWSALVILPQAVNYDYDQVNDDFYMHNLLDGQNAVAQTWLFFGNYVGQVSNYPLALFYVVAIIFTFFGSFLIVLRSTAQAFRHGGSIYSSEFKFSNLVLTSWDYSLKSHDAAVNLTAGISKILKEAARNEGFVASYDVKPKPKDPSIVLLARVAAWLITTLLIGGAVVAIFKLVITDLSPMVAALGLEVTEDNMIVIYTPAVCFMFINFIVPQCIYQLPRMENYSTVDTELRVNIARVFVLRIANLAALIFSLHRKIQEGNFKGCAGTMVGQELYKLLLLDTISQVLLMMVWRFARFYWQRKKYECDITAFVLIIIYRQALVLLGAIVVPPMPLLGVVTMATVFLGNYAVVYHTCRPLERHWNQPRHNTFFMTLTAVTLAILICLGAIISPQVLAYVGNEKNRFCGPFGNMTMIGVIKSYIGHLHVLGVPYIRTILSTLVSGAFVMPVVFILMAMLYFMYVRTRWERRQRRVAQAELKEERQLQRQLAQRRHDTNLLKSYGESCKPLLSSTYQSGERMQGREGSANFLD